MRCKPGDLAEIVRSLCGNEGRRVVVERIARPSENLDAIFTFRGCGALWVVQPLQPLRCIYPDDTYAFDMKRSAFPDAWLRPIRPVRDPSAAEREEGLGHEILTGIAHA